MKRIGLIDSLLLVSFAAIGFLLVKPGGPLSSRMAAWREHARLREVLSQEWEHLNLLGSPLRPDSTDFDFIIVSDYECRYCRRVHVEISGLVSTGEMSVGILQFPLSIHPHAEDAARVALCAARVGGFSEVHEYLMTDTTWMVSANWKGLASRLESVPEVEFMSCLDNPDIELELRAHEGAASQLGIRGTPTFIAETGILKGAVSPEDLMELLRR